MATLEITFTIGAQIATRTITTTDARALEFLDDLRQVHFVEDPILSRVAVGVKYIDQLSAGQVQFAKGLKQQRLDAAVSVADDLEGN